MTVVAIITICVVVMLADDYTGRPIARRVERAVEAFALAPLSVADAHRRGVVVERPAVRRPRRWGVGS